MRLLLAPAVGAEAKPFTLAVLTFAVYAVASLGGGVVLLLGRFRSLRRSDSMTTALGGDFRSRTNRTTFGRFA